MLENCNVIAFEGLISAGKSTLLTQMGQNFSHIEKNIGKEPVSKLQSFQMSNGKILNPLKLFYENQKENGVPF